MKPNETKKTLKPIAGPAPHVLIVEARFYEALADELVAGTIEALEEAGCTYERLEVPGAFEIPGAIAFARSASEDPEHDAHYDGYIGLGVVIRGETSHYDYVCGESARGLQDLAIFDSCAIGYGILTVENEAQAWARANRAEGDKGRAAADACVRMIELARRFGVPV